jgi:uncharacterized protein DUF6624
MKRSYYLVAAFFCFAQLVSAQTSGKYFEYVEQAKSSFGKKEYKKAAASYSNAFKLNAGKAYCEDRYDAARSWALAGNPDSAFVQLFKVATLYDYTNYSQISTDASLSPLHNDKRWGSVTDIIKQNIGENDGKLNRALVVLLDSVYRDHHSHRLSEISIRNESGTDSKASRDIRKTIREKDNVNLAIVANVLDTYGWLGKEVVGFIGNYVIVLIIQHADLASQEKYNAMAKDAFKKGNIDVYDYALLEDKIALKQGKKQQYGSVIISRENKNYVAPVEDPENLDKRRAELGLKPMNTYLQNWGLKWDIEKYKKDLLLLEKENIGY